MLQAYEVHYISRTKERKPGEWSALGWVNNTWCIVFPESVLRKWFGVEDPVTEQNLYAILSAKPEATPDEIKSAYRRMAMQWHPDRCGEQNAHEVFIRIQEAYNILSDTTKRARYDAGLALQKSIHTPPVPAKDTYGFRAPLRCGTLLVEGKQPGKWFVVDEIKGWEDIINGRGETLVSSWIYGEDRPQERWVAV